MTEDPQKRRELARKICTYPSKFIDPKHRNIFEAYRKEGSRENEESIAKLELDLGIYLGRHLHGIPEPFTMTPEIEDEYRARLKGLLALRKRTREEFYSK